MFFLNLCVTLAAFIGMEFMAWFTHKYVMHGFLWVWHSDHHDKSTKSWFEKNDLFFLIYATPGALSMILGSIHGFNFLFFIGLGITLYGFTYFLIHDIFIHQRFKIFRNSNFAYFLAIRKAHKAHHKVITKQDGVCFGMLVVPYKYFEQAKKTIFKIQ